jgi:hypothetical protein
MTKTTTTAPDPDFSPARQRLDAALRQKADALAFIRTQSDHSNRLAAIHEAVAPARDALSKFDADHASAMARWGEGLINGRPTSSAAHRDVLARALADAELDSDAAKVAQESFQAAIERMSAPLARLEIDISEAAKLVAVEQATSLLPAITAAIANADGLRRTLDAAREAVMAGFSFGSSEYNDAGRALHEFDLARGVAEARPMQGKDHALEWSRFTAALERDSSISFEDAAKLDIAPAPNRPNAPDPVMAAAAAVMSFPTNSVQR